MRGLIAAVRLARVCTTAFGAPVVPEVSMIHSVAHGAVGGAVLGVSVGARPTCNATLQP